MRTREWICGSLLCFTALPTLAQDSIYCPQNHGYISVGMTTDQVLSACGAPTNKQESNQPVLQKVPVKQLIYRDQGATQVFYGPWSIPFGGGNPNDGPNFRDKSTVGATLQVNIKNNKVSSVLLNSASTNAFSICNNQSIQVGDPASTVYNACGAPSLVNETYVNEPIPSINKPEIWRYEVPYQPSINLTFIDGKLQSIN